MADGNCTDTQYTCTNESTACSLRSELHARSKRLEISRPRLWYAQHSPKTLWIHRNHHYHTILLLLLLHLKPSRPEHPTNVTKIQGTKDVRLDPQLNKKVWESGVKGVPYRLRVRISRKRNDEEGAKEKLYSYVQAVNVKNARGLQTVVVEDV